MNIGDWIFFGILATLAVNHLLVRLPGWERRVVLFAIVQALNIGCASWVLALGLPGFDGQLTVVNWVVGLLFIVRAVQNNGRWTKARKATRDTDPMEDRKAEIRAALERGESEE
jgi:hypothetical protein